MTGEPRIEFAGAGRLLDLIVWQAALLVFVVLIVREAYAARMRQKQTQKREGSDRDDF